MTTSERGAGLSDEERAFFEAEGYVGPFRHPLLEPGGALAEGIVRSWEEWRPRLAWPGPPGALWSRLDEGLLWYKSAHLVIEALWQVAAHAAVLDRVRSLLGPDVLWWGSPILRKEPGAVHGWHYDSDFEHWDGLLVFVGLQNLSRASTLKLVARSHRIGARPVMLLQGGEHAGVEGGPKLSNDEHVLAAARAFDPACALVEPDMVAGDFYIAHGKTWHGSRNLSSLARVSTTLLVSRPDADVRIMTEFGADPKWYSRRPESLLLSGHDRWGRNALASPPWATPLPFFLPFHSRVGLSGGGGGVAAPAQPAAPAGHGDTPCRTSHHHQARPRRGVVCKRQRSRPSGASARCKASGAARTKLPNWPS